MKLFKNSHTHNRFQQFTSLLVALACVCFIMPQLMAKAQTGVNIPDAGLRGKIETALNKAAGDILTQEDMERLTYLHAYEAGIVDLTGLETATNLRVLSLHTNAIADVSPLANLTSLQVLVLNNNQISDVSPLANLTNLVWLFLQDNQIADFSSIANVESQLAWYVKEPQVITSPTVSIPDAGLRGAIETALGKAAGDTITQADMEGLTRLQINGVTIQNFKGLEKATNLQNLELIDNGGISDITPLAKILVNLTQLRTLGLVNNQIVNVSPLANLTQLTTLALGENQIVDVSPLARLTNLTTLALNNNQIADVSSLASLTNLITLLLHNNQIADFSPLTGLASQLRWYSNGSQVIPSPPVTIPDPGLRYAIEVTLGKNQDDTITQEDMESLTTLTGEAVVSVMNLTGLETATNLTSLHISGGSISDISPLASLTKLQTLNLSHNRIVNVSPLANLTNLTSLDISNNRISDFSPLDGLVEQLTTYIKHPQKVEAAADTEDSDDSPAPALHLHTDINGDGIIDARDVVGIPLAPPPKRTALFANYPNPFNPETWMPYALAKPADVTVSIYAMNGHLVRKLDLGHQAAGLYRSKSRAAYWDGRNDFGERVASGVYFYVFTAGDFAATRKMLILK